MANKKEEFYYDSVSGGRIHACRWIPESAPVAVFQIIHGIAEHIDRYDDFALFLNQHGILVVAEDHMGHGKSVDAGPIGYFKGGWFAAVDNCYRLYELTKRDYSQLPYFLFGHSMGSFLARSILIRYPDLKIEAAIICGTGWQPYVMLKAGTALCNVACRFGDEKLPNQKLYDLVFGAYNKRVEHPKTSADWLTRDSHVVGQYLAHPLCGFVPSAGLMRDMLTGMEYNEKRENLCKMNKGLPVLFIAGEDDPVGNYGTGVQKSAKAFLNCGMFWVDTKLFPLCRHEILNEINHQEVYDAILSWMRKILKTI